MAWRKSSQEAELWRSTKSFFQEHGQAQAVGNEDGFFYGPAGEHWRAELEDRASYCSRDERRAVWGKVTDLVGRRELDKTRALHFVAATFEV